MMNEPIERDVHDAGRVVGEAAQRSRIVVGDVSRAQEASKKLRDA
jgi:hypothetical protein